MTDSHVLHILAQRPGRTGSGVTLEALVRHCVQVGYEQAVVIGVPATDRDITVGDLPASRIFPLTFADSPHQQLPAALDFPVPGMSDVMPYESTVYSQMSPAQLEQYIAAWRAASGISPRQMPARYPARASRVDCREHRAAGLAEHTNRPAHTRHSASAGGDLPAHC